MKTQPFPQDAIWRLDIASDQIDRWLLEANELTEHDVMFNGELLELDAGFIARNDVLLL